MIRDDGCISPAEMANLMFVTTHRVIVLIRQGKLRADKVEGHWRIPYAERDRFLALPRTKVGITFLNDQATEQAVQMLQGGMSYEEIAVFMDKPVAAVKDSCDLYLRYKPHGRSQAEGVPQISR